MTGTLERFHERLGPGNQYREFSEAELAIWRGHLPELILDEWTNGGLRGFGHGLFWWIDPAYLLPVLDDWSVDSSVFTPFARTAWGDIFLWGNERFHFLAVQNGEFMDGSKRIHTVLNYWLPSDGTQEGLLFKSKFETVRSRIGAPAWDEMYGYEPALAIGGSGKPDTVRRYKLREHLSILAQLQLDSP